MRKIALLAALMFGFSSPASAQIFSVESGNGSFRSPQAIVFVPTDYAAERAVQSCEFSVQYLAPALQLQSYLECLRGYVAKGTGKLFDLRRPADVRAYQAYLRDKPQGQKIEFVAEGQ